MRNVGASTPCTVGTSKACTVTCTAAGSSVLALWAGGGGVVMEGAGSMRVHLRESSGNVDSVDSTEAESAAAESATAVSMAESRG